jgi:hypothetical protein
VPDPTTLADDVLAAMPVPLAGRPLQAASPPEPTPRARADRSPPGGRARAVAPAVAPSGGGTGGPPVAAPLVAAAASVPAAVAKHARHVVRAAARAQPGPADGSGLLPPPLGDPVGVSPNPLSAAASVLLGLWIAVLTTAIVLVLPRLRRRRRSGPAWRLPRGASSRLERPG